MKLTVKLTETVMKGPFVDFTYFFSIPVAATVNFMVSRSKHAVTVTGGPFSTDP